ncbi:MAG: glycosyl transferase family 1, partial [Kiritimatiellales bacterium]
TGTIAYALGAGKANVSTPYWYAVDMLSDNRGRLVPFRNAPHMAEAVLDLLDNEAERHAMRKRAYTFARSMIWPETAKRYLNVFEDAVTQRSVRPRPLSVTAFRASRTQSLPSIRPLHLQALTDDTGIMQHAKFTVPDREHGYSTDDQARALMVAVLAADRFPNAADWERLAAIYLSYLLYAFDRTSRRFNNFMSYDRTWSRQIPTEDVHARALWALAHVVVHGKDEGKRALAGQLLDSAMPVVTGFRSPRAQAFSILAIEIYLQRYAGASAYLRERQQLASSLYDQFKNNSTPDWPWLEDSLTYANARIAHAMITAGNSLGNDDMLAAGLQSLTWLDRIQTGKDGQFVAIGTNGWYPRSGTRARFDQQPIEAFTMIDACIAAYKTTKNPRWLQSAQRAFDWFLGRNDLRQPLCDYTTGGCRDGLCPDRVNQNQGAESTIVWLLSLILMHDLRDEKNDAPAVETGDRKEEP